MNDETSQDAELKAAVAAWAVEDAKRIPDSRARLHARILETVETWPDDVQIDWAEMAATLEYEQGNDRDRAEKLAFWRIKKERAL